MTFQLLAMLISSLVFNKNCQPCCLRHKERGLLQVAFTNAASNLLHALNSTAEQSVLDKIVDLINEEQRTMKSSPLTLVEAKELDSLLSNPAIMLVGP
jgi:hypothetical protein